ncbi:MAG: arginine deiminase-related protein [Thermoleophilaceae bacterium]
MSASFGARPRAARLPLTNWGIEDETSPLKDVLVGPPEHFEWLPTSAISKAALASGRSMSSEDAVAAHAEMVATYQDAGVRVHRLPADRALKYQVFSRDSSVWAANGPIVTQMNQWWRRGEYAPVIDFYASAGIEVAQMVSAAAFEGGDLVLPEARCALIGYCEERTQRPAAEQVRGWLSELGWEVRLQPFDPHFVHIDVIVCMVAPGLAAICEEAAPDGLAAWLSGKGIELLPVTYGDAMALGANVMALGEDRVISAKAAGSLNERLRALGLTVYDPDLWPFTMGGGGPHCLAQPLRRDRG